MFLVIFYCILLKVFSNNFTSNEVMKVPYYIGPIGFRHYTGFGEVNSEDPADKRRYLFYWFMESQRDPQNDPVVLWLNGGPGCSSLEGAMNENGPFVLNEDGTKVEENPYSWNKEANVIFLEQPAGVGYSYSMDTKDYSTCNDNRTADDVWEFLQKFFTIGFPQYLKNDFYISGESYAGHYVTVIARRIDESLKNKEGTPLNLIGYAIGNGCSDDENEFNSWPLFWSQHALLPQAQYTEAWELCSHNFFANQCGDALDAMWDVFEEINIYNIYGECYGLQTETPAKSYRAKANVPAILRRLYPEKVRTFSNSNVPCVNTENLQTYFNNDEVISALHTKLRLPWEICNDEIAETYDDVWSTMIPFHRDLLKAGYKVLFYSGDIDGGVDTLGTEATIDTLMPEMKNVWDRWYTYNPTKQVGGFFKKSKNLSFVTVRGSGHMVPQDRPYEIKQIITRWIDDEPF